jgi:integrase
LSTYRDGTGRWRYRCTVTLRDGSTERISGTPSAANTKLAAREAEDAHRARTVNPPDVVPAKKAAPAFSEFAKTWLAAYPASAENRTSTITEKEFHVRVHLAPYWGMTPIDRIDSMAVATMIGDLKKKKKLVRNNPNAAVWVEGPTRESEKLVSSKTVKNVTQTLHRILVSAHEWKILSEVPKFPKRKNVSAPWDWYTAEESALLLAATSAPSAPRSEGLRGRPALVRTAIEDRALIRFALRTGARAGEELAVSWGDVDWINRRVHFKRQYHKGKFSELKAGPARSVDLSGDLIEDLKALRARQIRPLGLGGPSGYGPEGNPQDLIFPADHTGAPRETWHLRDTLRKYARRAGLRIIKWHELRHSFASQLVSAGVPLKQVQEWLGHSTIHMTMRYSHLAPTSGAGFIGVLDRPVAVGGEGT